MNAPEALARDSTGPDEACMRTVAKSQRVITSVLLAACGT
jgi:hypothetical protein